MFDLHPRRRNFSVEILLEYSAVVLSCAGGTDLSPFLGTTSVLAVHRDDVWSAKEGGVPNNMFTRFKERCGLCVQLRGLLHMCICSCGGEAKMAVGESLVGVDAGPKKQPIAAFPSPEACRSFRGLCRSLSKCYVGTIDEAKTVREAILTHDMTLEPVPRLAGNRPFHDLRYKSCDSQRGTMTSCVGKTF